MNFPKNVIEVVRSAADKHGADIEAAIDAAEESIRKLPEFQSLVHMLLRSAVQEMIYEARHTANTALKRQTGCYGGAVGVVVGTSAEIQATYESVYKLRVAGTLLGLVLGRELADISATEYAIGKGHFVNACLATSLVRLVPAGKRVQDAVSEKKLRLLLVQAQRKAQREAA